MFPHLSIFYISCMRDIKFFSRRSIRSFLHARQDMFWLVSAHQGFSCIQLLFCSYRNHIRYKSCFTLSDQICWSVRRIVSFLVRADDICILQDFCRLFVLYKRRLFRKSQTLCMPRARMSSLWWCCALRIPLLFHPVLCSGYSTGNSVSCSLPLLKICKILYAIKCRPRIYPFLHAQ